MERRWTIFAACVLLVFAVAMRLLPHLPNFTPVTAVALVSAWYLGKQWGLVLPVLTIVLSDLIIGWYDWQIMASVYGSFFMIGVFSYAIQKHRSVLSTGLTLIGSSIFFFITTNTAVWWFSAWYEKSFSGLMYSYELGIPFFRNMLMGDLVYTAVLVIAIESAYIMTRYSKQLAKNQIAY